MLAIQKWAKDKPFALAIFAPQIASTSQDIHLAFRGIKERRILDHQFPLPHLPSWFRLYRSHRKPIQFISNLFEDFSSFGKGTMDFGDHILEGITELRKSGPESIRDELSKLSPQELQEGVLQTKKFLDGLLEDAFKEIESEISNEPMALKQKEEFRDLLSDRELEASFFFLVSIPCWILYRESPTRLYRKARIGHYDSLEKLLRLDSLMIHDPVIGKQIQLLRMNHKSTSYENLITAVLKKPKAKITRKKMKYSMAGFLSAFGIFIKHPLTEPQIRALFDAAVQDYHQKQIDTDLPDSPETFAKAIQRDRDLWLQIMDPDKKN